MNSLLGTVEHGKAKMMGMTGRAVNYSVHGCGSTLVQNATHSRYSCTLTESTVRSAKRGDNPPGRILLQERTCIDSPRLSHDRTTSPFISPSPSASGVHLSMPEFSKMVIMRIESLLKGQPKHQPPHSHHQLPLYHSSNILI
jgi:hypothetical protein